MKINIIGFFIVLIFFSSCEKERVYVGTVAVSDSYTGEFIDSLLMQHKSQHNNDIDPDEKLTCQFSQDFPNAKGVDWEASRSIFEVEFEISNIDYKAYYDKQPKLILYKYEIEEKNLPAVVKNTCVARYPDYNFKDIIKIHKGAEVIYQVELERNDIEVTIILKKDGTVSF